MKPCRCETVPLPYMEIWLSKHDFTFMENIVISECEVWLSVMFLATQFHYKVALLLGGLPMSLLWISKPVVFHMEEEYMLLSIFCYCVCTFLCRSFNPSLPFMLSYVAVSRPGCCLPEFYPNRTSIKCLSAVLA